MDLQLRDGTELHVRPIRSDDKELNAESNFPVIVKFLTEQVLTRQHDRIRDQAVRLVTQAPLAHAMRDAALHQMQRDRLGAFREQVQVHL